MRALIDAGSCVFGCVRRGSFRRYIRKAINAPRLIRLLFADCRVLEMSCEPEPYVLQSANSAGVASPCVPAFSVRNNIASFGNHGIRPEAGVTLC